MPSKVTSPSPQKSCRHLRTCIGGSFSTMIWRLQILRKVICRRRNRRYANTDPKAGFQETSNSEASRDIMFAQTINERNGRATQEDQGSNIPKCLPPSAFYELQPPSITQTVLYAQRDLVQTIFWNPTHTPFSSSSVFGGVIHGEQQVVANRRYQSNGFWDVKIVRVIFRRECF